MRIVTKDEQETFLCLHELIFNPIITNPIIPVNLDGYKFRLQLDGTKNILIDNYPNQMIFDSEDNEEIFNIQSESGKIYITFPMNILKFNFYSVRLYIYNSNLTILLNEFQLVKNNVRYGGGLNTPLTTFKITVEPDTYELINLNRLSTYEYGMM